MSEDEATVSAGSFNDDPTVDILANRRKRRREDRTPWLVPIGDHMLLEYKYTKFHAGSKYAKRFERLKMCELKSGGKIDYQAINDFQLTQRAREFIGVDMLWACLYNQVMSVHRELCVEFLCTFVYRPDIGVRDVEDDSNPLYPVEFRMFGKLYEMEHADFVVLTGLYREEEYGQPLFTRAVHTWADDELRNFWLAIAPGKGPFGKSYGGTNDRPSKIKDPLYCYFHRLNSRTIVTRHRGEEWMSYNDLFFLRCLLLKIPCNLAHCLADYFNLFHHRQSIGAIVCRHIITRIAKSLDLHSHLDPFTIPTILPYAHGRQTMYSMKIIQKIDDVPVLIGSLNHPWTAPDPLVVPPLESNPVHIDEVLEGNELPVMQDNALQYNQRDDPPPAPQHPQRSYHVVRLPHQTQREITAISGNLERINQDMALLKPFMDNMQQWMQVPAEKKDRQLTLTLALGVGVVALIVVAATISIVKILKGKFGWRFTKAKYNVNAELFLQNHEFLAPKRYSYSQVKKMTSGFKFKLGQGGFGFVYEGALSNGNVVAVKVLSELIGNGEDFINEVASVGRTCHVNIVTLVGFCLEGRRRALIYEFMPNGSLEKFVYCQASPSNTQLGWEKLYQIGIGIARGLEYLHKGCNTRILHFDIKPHNILLDQDFCPKIADFGLAKLFPENKSMITVTDMRGTPGYIAPELFSRSFGVVSHKSDVYSYGMMILEMVGGRKNMKVKVDHTSEIYFPHWIYKKIELDEDHLGLQEIVSDEEKVIAKKMIIVGLWCIQTNPSNRPTITKALEMLEGDLELLEVPPKPYISSPPRRVGSPSTCPLHSCYSSTNTL